MVHKHREILNNRNAIFSLCEASCEEHRGKTYAHASSSAISGLHACGVRYRLILLSALRCFKACCCESEPQMKEKRTINTKRYVGNNLLQLLVLEMGLLEIIFGPRSGRHHLLVQLLLIYSRFFFQFVDWTTTRLNP